MSRDKYRVYRCIKVGKWGRYPAGTFEGLNPRYKHVTGVADGCDRMDGEGPLVKKLSLGSLYMFKRIYNSRGGSHWHGPYPLRQSQS